MIRKLTRHEYDSWTRIDTPNSNKIIKLTKNRHLTNVSIIIIDYIAFRDSVVTIIYKGFIK